MGAEMITREQIIAEAEKVGIGWALGLGGMDEFLVTFYTIAFKAGRVAEREECAKVCDEKWKRETNFDAYFCGKAIRARGESK